MDDPRAWLNPIKVIPLDAAALTTSIEPFEQKAATGIQILPQTSAVATDSKILEVATEMLLHILHHGSASVRPLPLRLASFRAYASSIASPRYLQDSIPGPWLAVTGAGFPPA